MSMGYCPKCGNACEVIFTPYVKINGKLRYPKKGKVLVIPKCNCSQPE